MSDKKLVFCPQCRQADGASRAWGVDPDMVDGKIYAMCAGCSKRYKISYIEHNDNFNVEVAE